MMQLHIPQHEMVGFKQEMQLSRNETSHFVLFLIYNVAYAWFVESVCNTTLLEENHLALFFLLKNTGHSIISTLDKAWNYLTLYLSELCEKGKLTCGTFMPAPTVIASRLLCLLMHLDHMYSEPHLHSHLQSLSQSCPVSWFSLTQTVKLCFLITPVRRLSLDGCASQF